MNTTLNTPHWLVENYEDVASFGIKVKAKLWEEQTPYQKIEVYDSEYFGKVLVLDNIVMLSDKDEFIYHEMMSHPALCAHPHPVNVCVIGGGDGGVIREILKHPSVQQVVLCEIDERVARVSQKYFPIVAQGLTDPRVELVFKDGFQYLDQFNHHFDLIITDSTDPIGPAIKLFQKDYYSLVKKALKTDGIMICQSETPWMYEKVLSTMTQAMCSLFKNVQTYIMNVPLYPPSFTATFASDQYRLEDFNLEKSEKIATTCRYYDPKIHLAALVLPKFTKEVVRNQ